jgi:hypothetical protein
MSNEAQWLYPTTFNTSTDPTTRLQSRDIHRCAAISSHLTSYITTPHKRVIYIMTLHGEFCGTALSDGPSHQITQGTLGPITGRNDMCQGTNVGGPTIAFIPAIKYVSCQLINFDSCARQLWTMPTRGQSYFSCLCLTWTVTVRCFISPRQRKHHRVPNMTEWFRWEVQCCNNGGSLVNSGLRYVFLIMNGVFASSVFAFLRLHLKQLGIQVCIRYVMWSLQEFWKTVDLTQTLLFLVVKVSSLWSG